GNPISSAVTVPPNLRWTDIFSMLPITVGDRPVVYELTIKNSGLSLSTSMHMVIRPYILSSIFQSSPFGPLPYEGGSMITASYFLPLLISRATNFTTSSTMNLTSLSARPDRARFSFALVTIPLEASTWQTSAPACAAATVAPPVYANRFSTLTLWPSLPARFILAAIHFQLTACSGKRPVCLKPVGSI